MRRCSAGNVFLQAREVRSPATIDVGTTAEALVTRIQHRLAGGRGIRAHVWLHGDYFLDNPQLWGRSSGGFRRRVARDAGNISAGYGSSICYCADRGPEFWGAKAGPRACNFSQFGVHDLWRDANADFDLPVAECVTDSPVLNRGGCRNRWRSIPDNHLVEFCGERDNLYLLEYFSGTR